MCRRECCGRSHEQSLVQNAGDFNSQSSVGSGKSFARHRLAKFSGKTAEHLDLGIARPKVWPGQQLARSKREARSERIPDRANAALGGAFQHWPKD